MSDHDCAAVSDTVRADVGNQRRVCGTCGHWRKCLNYDEDGWCHAADSAPVLTDAYTQCQLWIANADIERPMKPQKEV
jgi:hypothetical protein